jgi:hypothetical protein
MADVGQQNHEGQSAQTRGNAMTPMPASPFIFNSDAVASAPEPAVPSPCSPLHGTAGPFDSNISNVGEIFGHARRLVTEASENRFGLDEAAFYDAIDPPQPPMFLRSPIIYDAPPDHSFKHILKVFFAMDV